MRFRVLGSSSRGNCALLETGETRVLIDAGFSGRRIEQMLKEEGLRLSDLHGVFLTHEHTDHVAGLRGLGKQEHLTVFSTSGTREGAARGLTRKPRWKLFEAGQTFAFADLEVTAVSIPHDALDPVAFVFSAGGEDLFRPRRSVAWVTDLGFVPEVVAERVRGADLLVLEANHDPMMLQMDPHRPASVKQRIRSRHGHLSNESARDFLLGARQPRWEHVVLAHLSPECNRLARVEEVFAEAAGAFSLEIVDPRNGGLPGRAV